MENPCKITVFGDSIAKGLVPHLKKFLLKKYNDYNIEILNRGISSETSSDGLLRLQKIIDEKPNVVIINFGMNDWRKGVLPEKFEKNMEKIVKELLKEKIRPILVTIIPDYNGPTYRFSQKNKKGISKKITKYNKLIRKISEKLRVRIADAYSYWMESIKPPQRGLEDAIHPNSQGYRTIIKSILPVLTRTQYLILWQFHGRFALCNYACPYCYYPTSVNKNVCFNYTIEKWERAFKKHFGGKKTVFYFSYGEPTIQPHFYEVLEMIGRHKNWEAKITTNLSVPLDKLMETKVAKENRLNINASFHPTQTTIDKFLKQLSVLRKNNIEPSVVYVMWPPQIDDLEKKYMPIFRKHGYVVHIRAFRGLYKGKKYPGAYTEEEWIKTAKYMDEANLKYMLGEVNALGRRSCIGMNHILIDNFGNVEMCDSYVGDGHYGNIFNDSFKLDLEPKPFPGPVPLAAVDDIADYVELGYRDLIGNNVLSYAKQGGVYKDEKGKIHYPYEHVNFRDKKTREKLTYVPPPQAEYKKFWLNLTWIWEHFIISFILKKYGRYIWAAVKGKWRLLRNGRLPLKNFWHA